MTKQTKVLQLKTLSFLDEHFLNIQEVLFVFTTAPFCYHRDVQTKNISPIGINVGRLQFIVNPTIQ